MVFRPLFYVNYASTTTRCSSAYDCRLALESSVTLDVRCRFDLPYTHLPHFVAPQVIIRIGENMRSFLPQLLIATFVSSSYAALRRGTKEEKKAVNKGLADGNKKNFIKEDEGFWNRFVDEVNDSVTPLPTSLPTTEPAPGPTPEPAPSPTPEPAPSPTSEPTPGTTPPPVTPEACSGQVSLIYIFFPRT